MVIWFLLCSFLIDFFVFFSTVRVFFCEDLVMLLDVINEPCLW